MASMTADLQYPIGRFTPPQSITQQELQSAIDDLAALPASLRKAVHGLDETQLDTPYRPGGWTVRQVVHHLADSHMNAFSRIRKALTETDPAIFAYDEKAWAELTDSRHAAVDLSLALIDALHGRLTMMLRSIEGPDWQRTFRHPERGSMRIDVNTLLYAWHGRHHVAHITTLRERQNWPA
jgi:hypothetical protein